MARLESESKGGYYPTPEKEMGLILKRIKANEGDIVSVLDPCAGKGHVLKQIKDHLLGFNCSPITYGIEIEKTRAKEAAQYADHILACGYEDTRISHDAFSFLYLNPPFMESRGERAEVIFFRDLTMPDSYMSVGSLIVLNIPQYVLDSVAKLVATRLENVRVYRFSDDNFSTYRQVIVYGYRKAPGRGRDKDLEDWLIELSGAHPDMLPKLDEPDWDEVQYVVPAQRKSVEIFTTTIVNPEEILKSLNEIDFYDKVFAKVEVNYLQNGKIKQPAMPLKITHMVQAIQSGALPEHMGDHLLVAKDEPVRIERTEIDPETGTCREVLTLKRKSIIRTFTATGHVDLR
jgi:hypothetical protein